MSVAIEYFERAKRGMITSLVEPGQQILKLDINSQRSRFVYDLEAGAEFDNDYGTALAMRIARSPFEFRDCSRIVVRCKQFPDVLPILNQVCDKLDTEIHPVIKTRDDLTSQYGIVFK